MLPSSHPAYNVIIYSHMLLVIGLFDMQIALKYYALVLIIYITNV